MTFSLEQIKAAHSKVKSGADFPAYVQDLVALGVNRYETFVADGHTVYYGGAQFTIQSAPGYNVLDVANKSNKEQFQQDLRAHQQGKTNYPTFCNDCAKSGIQKWIVDMNAMTCTYHDQTNNAMLTESIPAV